jgi:hypothetical protein
MNKNSFSKCLHQLNRTLAKDWEDDVLFAIQRLDMHAKIAKLHFIVQKHVKVCIFFIVNITKN